MRRLAGIAIAALLASMLLAGAARADGNQNSGTSESVSGQFKDGAHRIGEGAVHIGEGIKQGAIDVWDAAKAGASAAADKFRQATRSGSNAAPSGGSAQR